LRKCNVRFFFAQGGAQAENCALIGIKLAKSHTDSGDCQMRTNRALPFLAFVFLLVPGVAAAEPLPYSKTVQKFCAADYRKYCGDYGLESAALRSCMDRNGESLSPSCVKALVSDGQVSQAEVDRRKKTRH
jgi:hypothetical protein